MELYYSSEARSYSSAGFFINLSAILPPPKFFFIFLVAFMADIVDFAAD